MTRPADVFTVLLLGGAFLLIFCALGALSEVFIEWREERRAHRRLRNRIRRYHA